MKTIFNTLLLFIALSAVPVFAQSDFESLKARAEAGDSADQSYIGELYYLGEGVNKNYSEAERWFRLAAEQGHIYAQNNLGVMYLNGFGVAQNDQEAFRWFRSAAEQGLAEAQNNLGVMYLNGVGVAQNDQEALKWFTLAAEQGNADARENLELGATYFQARDISSQGVGQTSVRSEVDIRMQAEQGDARSQYALGQMLAEGQGVEVNAREAVKWLESAADQGLADAQAYLGWLYEHGEGVRKSERKAVQLYESAANQGQASAQNNLGRMYANGTGVKRNFFEAFKYYNLAAAQGDYYAQYNIGMLYSSGAIGRIGYCDQWGDNCRNRNYKEAVSWFKLSATGGFQDAVTELKKLLNVNSDNPFEDDYITDFNTISGEIFISLADIYYAGQGAPRDLDQARQYYLDAARRGPLYESRAQEKLGLIELELENYEEALKHFGLSSSPESNFQLGQIYERGLGVDIDVRQAIQFYEQGSEGGSIGSMLALSEIYQYGTIVEKDYSKALEYLTLAAELGNVTAKDSIVALNNRIQLEAEEALRLEAERTLALERQAEERRQFLASPEGQRQLAEQAERERLAREERERDAREEAERIATKYPYYAEIFCGYAGSHYSMTPCLTRDSFDSSIYLISDGLQGDYDVVRYLQGEIPRSSETSSGFRIDLTESFALNVQNVSDGLLLSVKVFNRRTGAVVFQRETTRFGTIVSVVN
jgi:TPR repeat protein